VIFAEKEKSAHFQNGKKEREREVGRERERERDIIGNLDR
jgi:hypothetical protein